MLREYPNKCWVFLGTLVAVGISASALACTFEKIYSEFVLLVAVVGIGLATYAAHHTDESYKEMD